MNQTLEWSSSLRGAKNAFWLIIFAIALSPLQGDGPLLWTLPKLFLIAAFLVIWFSSKTFYMPRELYWLIGFTVISFASSSLSLMPQTFLREWITVFLCLPIFLVSYNLFVRIPQKRGFLLLGLCLISLFYSFGYILPFFDADEFGRTGRFRGLAGNPNGLATYVLLSGLLLLAFSFASKALRKKVAFGVLAMFFIAILVATGSRKFALYLGISLLLSVVLFGRTPIEFMRLSLGAIILFAIGSFTYQFVDFKVLESRFVSHEFERALAVRLNLYQDAFSLLGERIWIGHGIGSFRFYSPLGLPAHGQIPETLFSAGIFGFIALMGFYINLGFRLFKKWIKERNSTGVSIDLLLYFCIVMMFAGFHYYDSPFHFFLMGYLMAVAQPVAHPVYRKAYANFRNFKQLPSS